jgi:ABC-type sugar transport system permease subunit
MTILEKERRKLIIPFLAPAVILYLAFMIIPAIRAFTDSLYKWEGFNLPKKYIGIKNFTDLLRDSNYLMSVKTTLYIFLVGGIVIFGLVFLFTAILNGGIVKGKKIFRAIIFFPNIVAAIALTTFWAFIYNNRFGLLNEMLRLFGLDSLIVPWTEPARVLNAVLVALIWIYVGYMLVILLAGADNISPEIYDAARVDGANIFQMFYHVTIPLMWDVIVVAITLWMIIAIKQFEFVYAFGGGTFVAREIWTVPLYLVVMGFGKRDPIYRLGYASAIGVSLLLMVVVLAALLRFVFRRERVEM